jgi:hypothetical protein
MSAMDTFLRSHGLTLFWQICRLGEPIEHGERDVGLEDELWSTMGTGGEGWWCPGAGCLSIHLTEAKSTTYSYLRYALCTMKCADVDRQIKADIGG